METVGGQDQISFTAKGYVVGISVVFEFTLRFLLVFTWLKNYLTHHGGRFVCWQWSDHFSEEISVFPGTLAVTLTDETSAKALTPGACTGPIERYGGPNCESIEFNFFSRLNQCRFPGIQATWLSKLPHIVMKRESRIACNTPPWHQAWEWHHWWRWSERDSSAPSERPHHFFPWLRSFRL